MDVDIKNEIWPIPLNGLESFSVSSMGRVKRSDGRILKDNLDIYIRVTIRQSNGSITSENIHKLVVYAFYGSHDNLVINHKNGIKTDNHLENSQLKPAIFLFIRKLHCL